MHYVLIEEVHKHDVWDALQSVRANRIVCDSLGGNLVRCRLDFYSAEDTNAALIALVRFDARTVILPTPRQENVEKAVRY